MCLVFRSRNKTITRRSDYSSLHAVCMDREMQSNACQLAKRKYRNGRKIVDVRSIHFDSFAIHAFESLPQFMGCPARAINEQLRIRVRCRFRGSRDDACNSSDGKTIHAPFNLIFRDLHDCPSMFMVIPHCLILATHDY